MDSSSGMKRRGGWTWKAWLGIALGVAVLVAVILIAANAAADRAASTDRSMGPPRPADDVGSGRWWCRRDDRVHRIGSVGRSIVATLDMALR
jgi:hypothetical protein